MLLSLIDQVGHPETGDWQGEGICLVDISKDYKDSDAMLHDGFFEKYWDWRDIRNKDWKLDLLDE